MGPSAQNSSGVHCCRRRSSSTRLRTRIRRRCGRIWCRARLGSTCFRRRFRRRFFGAEPGQVQQGSGEISWKGSRKPWCKPKSGSTESGEGCRAGLGEGFGNLWCRLRSGQGFQRLASPERFRKICKNKTLRLLGIPPKLIFQENSIFIPTKCSISL